MTELLGRWLTHDVGLSVDIDQAESTFSNGYQLAVLLHRLHVLSERDLQHHFQDNAHPHTLVQNFHQLASLLRSMGVAFDATLAKQIMQQSSGAIHRLLYEIKIASAKRREVSAASAASASTTSSSSSTSTSTSISTSGARPLHSPHPHPPSSFTSSSSSSATAGAVPSEPSDGLLALGVGERGHVLPSGFDRLEHRRLYDQLTKTAYMRHKEKHMNMHLHKFADYQDKLERSEAERKEMESAAREARLHQLQAASREKMHQQREFMRAWKDEGMLAWQANYATWQQNKNDEIRFEVSMKERKQREKMRAKSAETKEMDAGIEEFERNLERIGVDNASSSSSSSSSAQTGAVAAAGADAADAESSAVAGTQGSSSSTPIEHILAMARTLPPPSQQEQAVKQHLERIHQKTLTEAQAHRERDRRRRKVLVEQQRVMKEAEEGRQDEMLQKRLQEQSVEERKLAEDLWRVQRQQQIILDNRKFRDEEERKAREEQHRQEVERDRARYKQMQREHEREVQQEIHHYAQLRKAHEDAKHARNQVYCRDLAQAIVDIALKAATYREMSDQSLIPPPLWREWMALFVRSGGTRKGGGAEDAQESGGAPDLGEPVNAAIAAFAAHPHALDSSSAQALDGGASAASAAAGVAGGPSLPSTSRSSASGMLASAANSSRGPKPAATAAGAPGAGSGGKKGSGAGAGAAAGAAPEEEARTLDQVVSEYSGVLDVNRAVHDKMGLLRDANESSADLVDDATFQLYLDADGEFSDEYLRSAATLAMTARGSAVGTARSVESATAVATATASAAGAATPAQPPLAATIDTAIAAAASTIEALPGVTSNRMFGALLQRIVDVASGKEVPPDLPEVPRFPLGVCLLGKPFSGKRTVASDLAHKFGLRVLVLDELVAQAVTASKDENCHGSATDAAAAATSGSAAGSAVSSTKAKGGSSARGGNGGAGGGTANAAGGPGAKPRSVQQLLGARIDKCVSKGEAIPDDVYASLVVDAIKRLQQDASRAVDPSVGGGGGGGASGGSGGGWLALDFPQNLAQARQFEKELTGFEPPKPTKVGVPKVTNVKDDKKQSRVSRPPTPPQASTLHPSGIDVVLRLDCDTEVAVRRLLGRRVDPVTNDQYQLEHTHPGHEKLIADRLERVDDEAQRHAADACYAYDEQATPLAEWFAQFGTLRAVDARKAKEEVRESVRDVVRDVAQAKEASSVAAGGGSAIASDGSTSTAAPAAAAAAAAATTVATSSSATLDLRINLQGGALGGADSASPNDSAAFGTAATAASPATAAAGAGAAATATDSPSAFPPFYDQELATLLANVWIHAETVYTSQFKRLLRSLRRERTLNLEHFATVRATFHRFLTRPDDKPLLVSQFQQAFNAIHPDQRKDLATKEELHARCDELSMALWNVTTRKREEGEQELECIRDDSWVEHHKHFYVCIYISMIQCELDRYVAVLRILQDYFTAVTGQVLSEASATRLVHLPLPAAPTFDRSGDALDASSSSKKGGDAKKKDGGAGKDGKGAAGAGGAGAGGAGAGGGGGKDKKGAKQAPEPMEAAFIDPFADVMATVRATLADASAVMGSTGLDGVSGASGDGAAAAAAAAAAGATTASADPRRKGGADGSNTSRGGQTTARKGGKGAANAADANASASASGAGRLAANSPLAAQGEQLLRTLLRCEQQLVLARCARLHQHGLLEMQSLQNYAQHTLLPRLDQLLGLRVRGESAALDALAQTIRDSIELEQALPFDLRLEGENFLIDEEHLLMAPPTLPAVSPFDALWDPALSTRFSFTQLAHLIDQVKLVRVGEVASVRAVIELFTRLAATSNPRGVHHLGGHLPWHWQHLHPADLERFVRSFAMPADRGGADAIDWREMLVALIVSPALPSPSLRELQQMLDALSRADADRDGKVTFGEFARVGLWFEAESTMSATNVAADDESSRVLQWKQLLFLTLAEAQHYHGPNGGGQAASNGHHQHVVELLPINRFMRYLCWEDATVDMQQQQHAHAHQQQHFGPPRAPKWSQVVAQMTGAKSVAISASDVRTRKELVASGARVVW